MKILKAGVIIGLIGGALDITAALTVYPAVYGADPVRILQSIAEGVQGPAAFEGGAASAALGLGLHFFIAICAGLVLVMAMSKIALLRKWPLLTGAGFGLAMYNFMQLVVLPLSLAGAQTHDAKSLAIGLAIHMFIFGAPMGFAASRMLKGS